MTFSLSSTVPIGRLEHESARRVLEKCAPLRQQQALPYLLSLYSFIHWWENYACWDLGSDSEVDSWEFADDEIPWAIEITTTWCERPEIVELIDIADLSIQGVQLGIYPVTNQAQVLIHCPTLLGMIRADLCVGVRLEPQFQQATILGFISIDELLALWQLQPPNPQGFFSLPVSRLHPVTYLPERISRLVAASEHARVETMEGTKSLTKKDNRNFASPPSLNPEKVAQVLEKLSAVGVSPFAVSEWDQQTAIDILSNREVCQQVLAVHRLVRGFQSYSEQNLPGSRLSRGITQESDQMT